MNIKTIYRYERKSFYMTNACPKEICGEISPMSC